MAMTLKLSKTKTINPSTKKAGFRTTVKSNGKADMDTLVKSASKKTPRFIPQSCAWLSS